MSTKLHLLLACFVLTIAVLSSENQVDAKYVVGRVQSAENWVFVSKFCFGYGEGFLNWTVGATHNNLTMLMYYDVENLWNYVYNHPTLSCAEKSSSQHATVIHQLPQGGSSGVQGFLDEYRPHFWYIAFADCGSTNGITVDYMFEFTNPGGGWATQFGYDEQGILALYLVFFFLYIFLLALHVYVVFKLRSMEHYHAVIKLLSACILASFFSVFFSLIHYGVYASNGIGAPGLKGLGDLLDFSMDLILTLLVILVAKGWSITTNVLSVRDRTVLIVIMSTLILGYLSLFIWDFAAPNPASTLYFWESVPGYIIIALRLASLGFYIFSLFQTLKLETLPEKRRFYWVFGGGYAVWFISLPLIVMIAGIISATAPWVLLKSVITLKVLADFLSVVALTAIMWPTLARRYFLVSTGIRLLNDTSSAAESQQENL